MSNPSDPWGRNVDPFDAPEDHETRGKRNPFLVFLASVAIIAIVAILWLVIR